MSTTSAPLRIMAIDPGLNNTGWGIVSKSGNNLSYVASGVIKPPSKDELGNRLAVIFREVETLLKTHQPDQVAIEETFVNASPRDTLKLGQARGVALVVPAFYGYSVAEYAPNLVKKSIVGNGHASKEQIQHMVKILLPKAQINSADEADALAIAITHAHHMPIRK